MHRIVALALFVSISTFGCLIRRNENYCEGRNKNNNCTEPPSDAAMSDARCPNQTTCMAPTGVCKTDTGTCVQCTSDNKVACTGTTPICGADFTCRGCTAHSDCGWISNVCRPDGACAAESEVAYVEPGGVGTLCMKRLPCTLQAALGTNRPYIKIAGTITENVTVDGKNTTILADPGAALTPKTDNILLTVAGGSNLTVYDLEISGAKGGADAVYMPVLNRSILTLNHVKVQKNAGAGIKADGGTLNIFRSTISGNQAGGISMIGTTTFDIRNNLVFGNGADSPDVGGIQARPTSGSKLEFNTIVGNHAGTGSASTGGVYCDVAGFPVPNNLVIQNTGGASGISQNFGLCNFSGSLLAVPGPSAGFSGDYHLTANTPAGPGAIRDAVECSGIKDIDGEDRPKNGKCDLGADEY